MFCGGFMSDMTGSKATALEQHCMKHNRAFVRFDYSGHGQSSGNFEEGTIGAWSEDALHVFDTMTQGPQIIVGSSMGGWIMLLLALARPQRVGGLIGIASAPDFTQGLLWEQFTEAQQREVIEKGATYVPSCYGERPYPITRQLIEEGRNHLLLPEASLPITCPVYLLHGMKDPDVPWQLSFALMQKLESENVRVTLAKNGDHRMSTPDDLTLLCSTLEEMAAKVSASSGLTSADRPKTATGKHK